MKNISEVNDRSNQSLSPIQVEVNNLKLSEPYNVANQLHDFFAQLLMKLKQKLQVLTTYHLPNRTYSLLFFTPMKLEKVYYNLKNLKKKCHLVVETKFLLK